VAGVVNLRGRILSAVDLCRFFGLPASGKSAGPAESNGTGDTEELETHLVAVETPDMELTLLVDDVLAVETFPTSRIQDASGTVRGLRPEYVRGVAERPRAETGSMVIVLDLPAILADERLIVHQEIV
jgi:purine-binding chemotaxis protein CheW